MMGWLNKQKAKHPNLNQCKISSGHDEDQNHVKNDVGKGLCNVFELFS
jgi:hypothetical protein